MTAPVETLSLMPSHRSRPSREKSSSSAKHNYKLPPLPTFMSSGKATAKFDSTPPTALSLPVLQTRNIDVTPNPNSISFDYSGPRKWWQAPAEYRKKYTDVTSDGCVKGPPKPEDVNFRRQMCDEVVLLVFYFAWFLTAQKYGFLGFCRSNSRIPVRR